MTFVVKKIDLDDLNNKTGTFTHEKTGIELTLKSFSDKHFQKARNMIYVRDREDANQMKTVTLGEDFINRVNADEETTDVTLMRAMARFLIVEWNAVDENNELLPITGDNFIMLLGNIPHVPEFIEWCMDRAVDVAIKNAQEVTETKKKSSTATRGKKTTQA
ncbi:hypothetical protein [Psychrobacter sanguinis]|uniref:hypothetical protein n=1 Tax=Psychrobacter sanguinis TaxID=861445 RepID=UPI00191B3FCA|nr:hypothetical protein [Psychrobacter sanguinis]MCC3344857.1 hypothetical protein [Psychrobacter sanguinis]